MRILFVTGAFPPIPCGVGDYTAQLICHLNKREGVSAGVLTSNGARGQGLPSGSFFPCVARWDMRAFGVFEDVVKKFRPDVIHLQYPATFGRVLMPNLLPIYCALRKLPMVQTWHEFPIKTQILNALPSDGLVVVDDQYPANYSRLLRSLAGRKFVEHIPVGSSIPRVELSISERAEIHHKYNFEGGRLLVYFGFVIPDKGVERLFDIANPEKDRLLLICSLDPEKPAHQEVLCLAATERWKDKCVVTGYLDTETVGSLLAAADVAVFPFVNGSTPRNTSILAARNQGTLVVTTHLSHRGYDASEHTVYVKPGDNEAFRAVIDTYAGIGLANPPHLTSWVEIALRHERFYEKCIAGGSDAPL